MTTPNKLTRLQETLERRNYERSLELGFPCNIVGLEWQDETWGLCKISGFKLKNYKFKILADILVKNRKKTKFTYIRCAVFHIWDSLEGVIERKAKLDEIEKLIG